MPAPSEHLEASSRAWRGALAEVEAFSRLGGEGKFEAAETCRSAALALMEASLDAMGRAHRAIEAIRRA